MLIKVGSRYRFNFLKYFFTFPWTVLSVSKYAAQSGQILLAFSKQSIQTIATTSSSLYAQNRHFFFILSTDRDLVRVRFEATRLAVCALHRLRTKLGGAPLALSALLRRLLVDAYSKKQVLRLVIPKKLHPSVAFSFLRILRKRLCVRILCFSLLSLSPASPISSSSLLQLLAVSLWRPHRTAAASGAGM